MTFQRTLPWLRHTTQMNPSATWQPTVEHRDVYILDRFNAFYGRYNLTNNSLTVAANRQTLKNMLIAAATHVDADADGLPDDWEIAQFSDLSQGPNSLAPNGSSVLFTFAFSQQKAALDEKAEATCRIEPAGPNEPFLVCTFRRRQGLRGGIIYNLIVSDDLETWTSASGQFAELSPPVPLYDGSGTELVTLGQSQPFAAAPPRRVFRVRVGLP
ncbi:MAG: hypothetical protein ACR2OZ_05815 [Verrucomicrobiales bacterium]